MEVSSIAHLAVSMSQERTNQAVAVAVLKKAIDVQAGAAMALVNALPAPPNLPANLGQNVNTTA